MGSIVSRRLPAMDIDGAARPPARVGVVGVALMVAGAVMVLVSFTAADWYEGTRGADSVGPRTFGSLHTLTKYPGTPAVPHAYFSWLAWVLLIASIILALGANLPTAYANHLRVLGALVGMVGAGATYVAIEQPHQGTSGSAFDNASAGIWLALLGFLLAGAGAAIGPLPATRAVVSTKPVANPRPRPTPTGAP